MSAYRDCCSNYIESSETRYIALLIIQQHVFACCFCFIVEKTGLITNAGRLSPKPPRRERRSTFRAKQGFAAVGADIIRPQQGHP
jgi:hypothetical protein